MRGEHAWIALIAAVTAWEAYALTHRPDDLLSRAVDRVRASHPAANLIASTAIITTAGHLLRALGPLDPFRVCS